uniref:Jacalin-related lectin 35 n=1 Tax=Noccaea caerulescens TaxID=107243 RepID=A0A1J3D952_NOCCA
MAQKLDALGGRGGEEWDDGSAYDNVKKVYVGQGDSGVVYVKFDYEKDGKTVSLEHGKQTLLGTEEFELDPEDYITCVKVYYEKLIGSPTEIITALIFKTYKGKTSQPFGMTSGTESELGGGKIIGFHGSASDVIHSLGAYIAPSSTPLTPSDTVPAQGGDAGVAWDDGVHDGVKKIYVGQGDSCVTYFKAEYEKASKLVLGSDHGSKSLLGAEEFVLGPGEYVTAVSGYYDKVFGLDSPAIISLKFITNKRTSIPYGLESGTEFVLEKKDHKVVGFYGQAGDFLYKIGVKVAPISD